MIRPGAGKKPARTSSALIRHSIAVAAKGDLVLGHGERLAGGDEDLLSHQVEPRHGLGDRVLDLDPGVHLHEEVLPLGGQEPFDRSRRSDTRPRAPRRRRSLRCARAARRPPRATGSPRRASGDVAGSCSRARRDGRRSRARQRGPAPRRAADPRGTAPRRRSRRRSTSRPGGSRRRMRARRRPGRAHDLHALASATRGGLDDQWVAELLAEGGDLVARADGVDRAGDDRDAGSTHRRPCGGLRAHQLDRGRRRPDPHEAGVLDEPRERSVLREEPVAGVDRLRTGSRGDLDDGVAPQVALRRGAGPEPICLVRSPDVRGPPVGVRIDGDAPDPELAQRAEDADRDLAAVGDEHLREGRHVRRILLEP